MSADSSAPEIGACDIYGNHAAQSGGGLYFAGSLGAVSNCLIARNTAGQSVPPVVGDGGGASVVDTATTAFVNDTFVLNDAGVGGDGIHAATGGNPVIFNCLLWGHGDNLAGCTTAYTYVGDGSMSTINGNIMGTVVAPSFENTATGSYRLAVGSPCINTGTNAWAGIPAPDLDNQGLARPYGPAWDMGAYEYNPSRLAPPGGLRIQ